MSALDRHIIAALWAGDFVFDDAAHSRIINVGRLELCKSVMGRWYLVTDLEGGVSLSKLTQAYLDLVRIGRMKRAKAAH